MKREVRRVMTYGDNVIGGALILCRWAQPGDGVKNKV